MRMVHVLDKLKANGVNTQELESTGQVVRAMIEDIKIESEGEVIWSREAEKEIGKAAALYYAAVFEDHVALYTVETIDENPHGGGEEFTQSQA